MIGLLAAAIGVAALQHRPSAAATAPRSPAGSYRSRTTVAVATRPATSRPAPTRPANAPRLATARPASLPCASNRAGREVLVSLARRHMWLCDGRTSDADFPVTSGRRAHGDSTPTGTYAVQARTRNTILNPAGGGAFRVKYWIPFKWGIYGFHDAPWQTIPFGSPQYTTSGSQGCVHLRTRDIARLFDWVALGTTVKIVNQLSA